MQKIAWTPTQRQAQALASRAFETLYGGARGGGKTDAGIVFPLYHIDEPRFRFLVIRHNAEDLKDWCDRAEFLYRNLGAIRSGNPPEFKFPSGAKGRTGHLRDDQAYTKYQGHEYQNILIEELTQIESERNYERLISSCRSTIVGIDPQVFLTTNPDPGTPGHKWVMKRFIEVSKPNIPFTDPVTGLTRVYIPARVDDNPYLMLNDPRYVKWLDGLSDERLRRAWREGIWEDVDIEGSYYGNLMKQAESDSRIGNVPYEPKLLVNTAWDMGMDDYTSIIFFQMVGREMRIIDYLESNGEGLSYYAKELQARGYVYGQHYGPFDLQVRELGSGITRIETARSLGIKFEVVDKLDIEDGINAVRMLLPRCYIDRNKCKYLIEALRGYRKEFDEKHQVYKNAPVHDDFSHGADAMRYLATGVRDRMMLDRSKVTKRIVPLNQITGF